MKNIDKHRNKIPPGFIKLLNFVALLLAMSTTLFIFIYSKFVFFNNWNTKLNILSWIIVLTLVGLTFFIVVSKNWIYRNKFKILLLISGLIMSLVIVEIVFRITDTRQPKYLPHHYLDYYGSPNYRSEDGLNIHNSLGFRGPEIINPKPQNVFRIAILGGSTAYETGVNDWRKDFARQLEKELRLKQKLNIEVINAALPGWNSWEDLINFEFKVIDLNPDLVIVYEGINDVIARTVVPSSYIGDNSGYRAPYQPLNCWIHIGCLKIVQKIVGVEPAYYSVTASTFDNTRRNVYSPILGMTPVEVLQKNPPIFFERNLKSLIAIASEYNIKVLLATFASTDIHPQSPNHPHYKKGVEELNKSIIKIAELKKIPLFDFASKMSNDPIYWADSYHSNELGIQLKSKLFSDFIIENNLIVLQHVIN